ncbi:LamB/YcsF family protein [Paraglaciecola sp. L3A3]|uniref:LamB/YcsF family protein n=1 Tax=Paraglaciecola sp. L3A3 TaxID=2686358 RepID=UPI00131B6FA1|nr:LamB/YcsF family protein [Paraglaciecola sp. L3A3]
MHKKVDINCDLGEGETFLDCQQDAQLMPFLSRCNIACGGHAGNQLTMLTTLQNAQKMGVLSGAHPGYADPDNFGRLSLEMKVDDIINSVIEQIANLETIAQSIQQPLSHIKLHGALYNDAEKSLSIAQPLCQALTEHYPNLPLLGLANGVMQAAAKSCGLTFLREGFMDRAYLASGHLAPRTLAGSVYQEIPPCIDQVLAMLTQQKITVLKTEQSASNKTTPLYIDVDTYCLHGDSPIALKLAQELSNTLKSEGYTLA